MSLVLVEKLNVRALAGQQLIFYSNNDRNKNTYTFAMTEGPLHSPWNQTAKHQGIHASPSTRLVVLLERWNAYRHGVVAVWLSQQ